MASIRRALLLLTMAVLILGACVAYQHMHHSAAYLGFDRNDYPGDESLAALHKSFAFAGYWLSNPPGTQSNSWHGKRVPMERAGFGFLLLYQGRMFAELKGSANPGAADGAAAAVSARAEGFPRHSIIFLDQEEGGRMLPEQKQYVFAWAGAVRRAGFHAGVYCSGIEVPEQSGGTVSTARDLHDDPQAGELAFWVANDVCPPSVGCAFSAPLAPEASGYPFAEVWQFAQSPIRKQFAAACAASYSSDGNCYPPELGPASGLHLDLDSARSPDPSHARQ